MRKRLLSFTLLLLAGLTAVQAYDFSAVTPSGQTLFYTIDTVTNTTVSVVGFDNTQPLGNLTIPSTVTYGGNTYSVTSIGIMAFFGCKGLTSVAIPNSVTSIGRAAFGECEGLTSVTMPNSITSIELTTFGRCSSLTSVTIPNSVTSIERGAFSFCTSLTLTIPSSVTTIGIGAFDHVRHIEYHGTATGEPWDAISMNGYQDNDFIYSDSTETMLLAYIGHDSVVTVANTVDTIGPNAFYSCSWLTSVSLPNSVTSIGMSAFYECKSLTSMTIPNSVTSIGMYAFYLCTSLTTMTIPNSVTTIEPGLLWGCEGLTSVTIPNSVTKICHSAFTRCTSIASLSIPNSVDTIEPSAFGGGASASYNVRHVTYYGSALDTLGYWDESEPELEGLPILETWGARSINGYIENGIVYTDSTKTTIRIYIGDAYRIGADSVTIPNSVTAIYSPGFSNCRGPLSVALPNSLTKITNNAFAGCTGLTSIVIPDSVISIGYSAFSGCENLRSLTLPNAHTTIGLSAFNGCTSLTSLTIPSLVSVIGNSAFGNCAGLTSLYYEADSCLSISYAAFGNDTNITQLVIGENVRWIPDNAFSQFGRRDGIPIIISASIISKSRVAPALGTNVFAGVADTVTVYIPCGSRASYESRWSYFSNFVEVPMETLTVTAANSGMGMAEVLEEPTCANGSSATIAATANYGYHFTSWSDGDTANPRTIVVTSDTVLTALFERNEYMLTVVCDTAQGAVTGAGTYLFGDTAHVEAVANEGFMFSHWEETGSTVPVLDTVVNGDMVLTAVFVEAVGIEDAGEQRVALYPNPTTGLLMIDGEDVLHVEVYDLDGRIMMRAEQAKCLDLGQLSAGLYYVRAVCQQGVMVIKIVKK